MFKKIIFIAACTIVSIGASAQVKFGLKGGISFANAKEVSGNTTTTFNSIVAPTAGLTIDFPGSKSFNIQSGLMYSGMGGKDNDNATLSLGYLSIPVLAKFEFGSGFHGYAGPQLSFLLSAKAKYAGAEIDYKDQIKGSGVFGVFGLGYNVSEKVNIFGEYVAGISNLAKVTDNGTKTTADAFSIGLGFNLK
jgi:hypothetical protein